MTANFILPEQRVTIPHKPKLVCVLIQGNIYVPDLLIERLIENLEEKKIDGKYEFF